MALDLNFPADDEFLSAFTAKQREQIRALVEDMVVNAGKLQGLTSGNGQGQISVSNGTQCTGLNAERVGGNLPSAFASAGHGHNAVTGSSNGFMINTDKTKIDGIQAGAEVNQMAFSYVLVSGTTIQADAKMDTLEIVAGTGMSIIPDATNDRLTISLASGAAVGNLGYTPVNKAGDTMTGLLVLSGNPTAALGAATKQYVDAAIQGLAVKLPVKAATTTNITLSGTQTIDGIAVVAGDRVLVKDQTTASQNGIYVVAASTWTRTADADTAAELLSAYVLVQQGTTNADSAWMMTTDGAITIGTTSLTWTQFQNAMQITAGTGLQRVGNVLSVVPGSTLSVNISGNAATVTKLAVARTIAGVIFDGSANIDIPYSGLTGTPTIPSSTAFDAGHSFVTNGYQKLSNGFILQWGYGTTSTNWNIKTAFPVVFPNACLFVAPVVFNGTNGSPTADPYGDPVGVKYKDATGFYGGDRTTAGTGLLWFAIGY